MTSLVLRHGKNAQSAVLAGPSKGVGVFPSGFSSMSAHELRFLAISHLRKDKGAVVEGFRGEYSATSAGKSYEDFLEKQGKDGVWATDIEASALAEDFQVNLVVTTHNSDSIEHTFVLYRAENDSAPTVHLQNWNNKHWSFGKYQSTPGDGDCLYHAFRQAMNFLAAQQSRESRFFKPSPVATRNENQEEDSGLTNRESAAIAQQGMILAMVQRAKKPSEIAREQKAERARIEKLSPEEQQQIHNDYDYALHVAMNL